jgi:hypothetical protein
MHSSNNGKTKKKHTIYIIIGVVLALIVGGVVIALIAKPSTSTGTATQANVVDEGLAFVKSAGFTDPTYLGVKKAAEGQYPTYRAKAPNGESIDMWLRTDLGIPWKLQPVGYFRTDIESAEDLVRVAQQAVDEWEHMPPDIRPSTDGSFGEYESRQYDYELLGKYAASRN